MSGMVAYGEPENCFGYDFMETFVTNYAARDAGTEGEAAAAEYLAEYFSTNGLSPYSTENAENQYLVPFDFVNPNNKRIYTSQNVAGIKYGVNTSGKQIIIGAHYDSVKNPIGIAITGGDGAYDNGSGVGALAQIISELQGVELSVDIIFVAFGAEELGLFGSKYMAENMSEEQINNTILMINIDSIAAGDYLYLYTDEVRNSQEDYMISTANAMGIDLQPVPDNKKTYPVADEYSGLSYTHDLLLSDQSSFMKIGIDVALFVGYNLEDPIDIPRESTENPNIMHTTNDTMAKMLELYGSQVNTRINNVALIVNEYVTNPEITSIMAESHNRKYDYHKLMNETMLMGLSLSIKAVVLLLFILIGYKLMKKEKNIIDVNNNDKVEEIKTPEEAFIYEDLRI